MKDLKKLGKALTSYEQKSITGGRTPKRCNVDSDCGPQTCIDGSRPICADNRCGLEIMC